MCAFLDKKERYDVGDLVVLNVAPLRDLRTITGIVIRVEGEFAYVRLISGYERKVHHRDLHFMNKV